jgi:hypothetical protein
LQRCLTALLSRIAPTQSPSYPRNGESVLPVPEETVGFLAGLLGTERARPCWTSGQPFPVTRAVPHA